jgi:ferredoxin
MDANRLRADVAAATWCFQADQLAALLGALASRGYRLVGPTRRDGAIVYDHLASADDLPAGWTDRQEAGRYRLERRRDRAWFGYVVGPHSWKRFLHPASIRLWSARKSNGGFVVEDVAAPEPPYAFIGVRACDVAAMARQDQVLRDGPYADHGYASRRVGAFVVAVDCTEPGGTCFCASMETGPAVEGRYDLALTELIDDGGHRFLVRAGSERGAEVFAEVPHSDATEDDRRAAASRVAEAAGRMGRRLETSGLKEAIESRAEHRRWDEIAGRCLTCGSCTMACPTCFCTTVEDRIDLTGVTAERWRRWDTCFSLEFSYMHGGSVRLSPRSRYRQWLTHKLATWVDQFGVMGCVGCGRCITWCPVGIDIVAEARGLSEASGGHPQ